MLSGKINSMSKPRYLAPFIKKDIPRKMVFIAGPRQVGKTTLADQVAEKFPHHLYLSWDDPQDRRRILKAEWPVEPSVIVLDELHKYLRWKSWIKGQYDKYKHLHHFIVTGSARLDVYRKGGDSLQGRYHHYRLHPFSVAELSGESPAIPVGQAIALRDASSKMVKDLMQFGGFPEPILDQSERVLRRWQKERMDRLLREDVRDLENVRDLSMLQILADMLPERVGSLLSLNSLREDLEVSFRAVSHWVDIFEKLYYVFRLYPFSSKRIRAIKKQPKLYMWDWAQVQDMDARFENLIASHLLKLCHFLEDTEGHRVELSYLRDADKRETDFLVTIEGKPWFAVEAKVGNGAVSQELLYFRDRLKIPHVYQVVQDAKESRVVDDVSIVPAHRFLAGLV